MRIIYGPKGTGKTQAAIDSANAESLTAKGHVLFVSDSAKNMYDLKHQVRFIDTSIFDIKGEDGFRGFLKGLVAANADNEYIYIDSVKRITKKELNDLNDIFSAMEFLEKEFDVTFVLTATGTKETLPDFILKHVD
ncbi:MAG: ATP-binding protein [Clostridia bacterium]|nr:ATP-binding protein [Clostridia bacterium]